VRDAVTRIRAADPKINYAVSNNWIIDQRSHVMEKPCSYLRRPGFTSVNDYVLQKRSCVPIAKRGTTYRVGNTSEGLNFLHLVKESFEEMKLYLEILEDRFHRRLPICRADRKEIYKWLDNVKPDVGGSFHTDEKFVVVAASRLLSLL